MLRLLKALRVFRPDQQQSVSGCVWGAVYRWASFLGYLYYRFVFEVRCCWSSSLQKNCRENT